MPQKPPDLDEYGNPIPPSTSGKPPDLDEFGNPIQEPPSMWSPEVIGQSLKKGFFEGVPDLPEPGWNYPGAQRQDWIGDVSRLSMIPVGGAVEVFNKLVKPLTSIPNAALAALTIAQPEVAPIAGTVFGAQMASELPHQVGGAYRQAQETGAFSPEAIGQYGQIGATGLMALGAGVGAAKHLERGVRPIGPRVGVETIEDFQGQGKLPFPAPPKPPPPRPPMPQAPPGEPFLPFEDVTKVPEVPIKPPINQVVAEAVAKPAPAPETMLDVEGPKGLEVDLTTMEGIQKAYVEGKMDRETALKNMAKIHRKLLKKPEPVKPVEPVAAKETGVKTVEEGEEIIFDPDTGQIISDKPYPLTEEPAVGVAPPPGVQEVTTLMTTKQVKNVAELQKRLGLSFQKTKELWSEAKDQGKLVKGADGYYDFPKTPQEGVVLDTAAPGNQIGIPANRVTREFLENAEARGYRAVGKSEGGEILFEAKGETIGDLTQIGEPLQRDRVIIPRGEADEVYITNLRKDGYLFKGYDKDGSFVFERPTQKVFDEKDRYIFKQAEPDSVNEPVFKTKEGFTIDELEEAVERRQAQVKELRAKAANEPGSVGPIHQALAHAEKGAKAAGIKLSVARKEEIDFRSRTKGKESDVMRMTEREWSEDTSQSRLTPEERELWNRYKGVERTAEVPPEEPRFGWQIENEFGPSVRQGERPLQELFRREGQKNYDPETGMGGMDIPEGGLRDVIEIFRGTIASSTPQVAGKELLQNAIDATTDVPGGRVRIVYNQSEGRSIKVEDNGPGIPIDRIWTDYLNLTGSGKRGGEKRTIGELGVGKVGYLTKGEWFEFRTVTREPDGRLMEHKFHVVPDDVIDHKVRIESNPVPEGTPTGVWTEIKIPEGQKWHELTNYLRTLEKHSKLSVPIEVIEEMNNIYRKDPVTGVGIPFEAHSNVITPKAGTHLEGARFLAEGTSPGAKFRISIPRDAVEMETNKLEAILVSRGMFQGAETVYLGKKVRVPDSLVIELDPTVKGTSEHYPLTTPTREKMRDTTRYAVQDVINDVLVEGAAKAKELELERTFKGMVPTPGKKFVMVDPGGRFTEAEIAELASNKELVKVAQISQNLLDELTTEFSDVLLGSKIYSQGFILDPEVRGMNVRNPHGKNEHAILINPINIMKYKTPAQAADAFVHVIMHEFTHMMAWEEGAGFTSAFADVYTRFGPRRQVNVTQRIERLLTAGSGKYSIEMSDLLSRGQDALRRSSSKESTLIAEEGSRITQREGLPGVHGNVEPGGTTALRNIPVGKTIVVPAEKATPANVKKIMEQGFEIVGETEKGLRLRKVAGKVEPPILEEELGGVRPTSKNARIQQLGPVQDKAKASVVAEAFNLSRGVLASNDLSAPLRQGLPLIHKKAFWKALGPLWQSWMTEEGFVASQNSIAQRALFKRTIDPLTGKEKPSFADDAGLKLTDLTDLSNREERIMSTWAESGGMFEHNKFMREHGGAQLAEAYRGTLGAMVRKSNRAYVSFLNNLRADVFESLIKDGNVLADVKKNLPLTREIAGFVNTATGRGSLGKLEQHAVLLNTGLFAPRLIASRLKMLNPGYYIMASPLVRKEALKSLFAVAGFGSTILQLAKMAGAEVSNDPNSSDFGKAVIGNTRLDPWAGFQQYVVAANRLIRPGFARVPGMEGGTSTGIAPLDLATGFAGGGGQSVTSSTSGKQYDLWKSKKGPYDPTHLSILGRFLGFKANPVVGFGIALALGARELSGKPMNFTSMNPMENSIMQRFIPIIVQDVYQLAQEDPRLLPLAVPAGLGMGVQTYGTIQQ
jgi:hypothetical protein